MSTGTTWALIGACAVITAAIKAAGPVALGGRALPLWFSSVIALMAPALFAALVVTQALANGRHHVRVELLATVLDKAAIKQKGGRPMVGPAEPYAPNHLTLCGALVVGHAP